MSWSIIYYVMGVSAANTYVWVKGALVKSKSSSLKAQDSFKPCKSPLPTISHDMRSISSGELELKHKLSGGSFLVLFLMLSSRKWTVCDTPWHFFFKSPTVSWEVLSSRKQCLHFQVTWEPPCIPACFSPRNEPASVKNTTRNIAHES